MSQTAPRQRDGASDDVPSTPPPSSPQTVEALVRGQLSRALGGKRGMLESALPTLGFTISWVTSHDLRLSLGISLALAVALLAIRLVQHSSLQFVLNAMFGIAIAAIFALRSGRAEDAFLPGLLYNAGYAVVMIGSVLLRWPLMGFMIGGLTGDITGWHRDAPLRALCSRLTWLLALPCVLRVLVQYPLWSTGHAGWLGIAKLAMGWPLQLAALAAMLWVLNRDNTPAPAPTS